MFLEKFKKISILDLEKKLVFIINSFLIILMTIFFLLKIPTKYFFYTDITLTLIIGYIFFKRSRKLSRYLILTNLFIFFYFLYPMIGEFLYYIFNEDSYIFILLYNVIIAYIFIMISGLHNHFIRNIKKTNIKLIIITILIGIILSLIFFSLREPVPINSLFNPHEPDYFLKTSFFTLILSISEQIIFSGFLFNVYKNLTNRTDAIFQVSTIFFLFHILRFGNLIKSYFLNFNKSYLIMLSLYYLMLFIFMTISLYLYSFKGKKYRGNIIYPILLHFTTDFLMFVWIKLILYN